MIKCNILLILLFITPIFATESMTTNVLAQLKSLNQQGKFGEYFNEMMELKVQQGSKVDAILKLIKDILDQLITEQSVDDMEYTNKMSQFDTNIKNLEQAAEQLAEEVQTINRKVGDVSEDIAVLTQQTSLLNRIVFSMTARFTQMISDRQDDQEAFQKKQDAHKRLLGAVNQVLTYLKRAVVKQQEGQSVAFLQTQKKNIVKTIKQELGDKHPIALMVEMTAKFDEATAVRAIEKLESIKAAIESTISQEQEEEEKAVFIFNFMNAMISGLLQKLGADLKLAQTQLRNAQNDLIVAQRRSVELTQEQSTTELLLVSMRQQRETVEANYQARRAERGEEIKVVQSAYDLLSQNAKDTQEKITPHF